jgi:cytochrome d ubiquinol oxidase subunit II
MREADAVAAILWLSLTTYAVLAGADFGGGVWDLFAFGPRAREQRRAVSEAMGPVWEANHVWLIFMITGMFTAFPVAFGALAVALFIPLTVVMFGIVMRGAAFAFRAHGSDPHQPSTWGVVFGVASIVTPIFLGAVTAAVAGGSIRVSNGILTSGYFSGWTSALAAVLGLWALALFAYEAATYLMVETAGRPELERDFRIRALSASLVSGALGLTALVLAWVQAPLLFDRLTHGGLPFLVLALINGPIAAWAVLRWRPRLARIAVAAQVVFVLWAWAVGQWPYLIPPDVTIQSAAAPRGTLDAMLVVIAVGMAVLLPSLWLLFRVFKGVNPAADLPPTTHGARDQ